MPFLSGQLTWLLAYFIYSELVKGDISREVRKAFGVSLRPVGEHGAPEAAAFTTQSSEWKWAIMKFYIF